MNPLFLMLALVTAAPATSDPVTGPGEAVVEEVNEAAERLRAEAFRLFEDRGSWAQAARLLERSGDLRSEGDPARIQAFLVAGRIYTHTGSAMAAQRSFEKAAYSAARIGAITEAAGAYLDAALVAAQREDRAKARQLVENAALLAMSPHLEAVEAQAILRRIPASHRKG